MTWAPGLEIVAVEGGAWLESWRPAALFLAGANCVNTRRSYATVLRQFVAAAAVPLGMVVEGHVLLFKMQLVDLGRAPATVRHRLGVLSVFFAWAIERGHHPGPNPAAGVSRPPRRGVSRFVALDGRQVAELLAACPCARDRALLALLADAGLRMQEVVDLRERDLQSDGGSGVVVIRAGKGGRTRKVALTRRAVELVGAYLEAGPRLAGPGRPLFQDLGGRGRRLTTRQVDRRVRLAARRAGLGDIAPHDLRRTFASRALDAGAPLPVVQAAMGHSRLGQTADYYLRPLAGGRSVAAYLDGVVGQGRLIAPDYQTYT